jgi:hypothetical protein
VPDTGQALIKYIAAGGRPMQWTGVRKMMASVHAALTHRPWKPGFSESSVAPKGTQAIKTGSGPISDPFCDTIPRTAPPHGVPTCLKAGRDPLPSLSPPPTPNPSLCSRAEKPPVSGKCPVVS